VLGGHTQRELQPLLGYFVNSLVLRTDVGGDLGVRDLKARANESAAGALSHHGYGPTEATVARVDFRCPPGPLRTAPPIGTAMANHRAYVLDAQGRLAPDGVPGELYVAGSGLARGYLGLTQVLQLQEGSDLAQRSQ
jgi:non-ribosomal peptide synthetase component F